MRAILTSSVMFGEGNSARPIPAGTMVEIIGVDETACGLRFVQVRLPATGELMTVTEAKLRKP